MFSRVGISKVQIELYIYELYNWKIEDCLKDYIYYIYYYNLKYLDDLFVFIRAH